MCYSWNQVQDWSSCLLLLLVLVVVVVLVVSRRNSGRTIMKQVRQHMGEEVFDTKSENTSTGQVSARKLTSCVCVWCDAWYVV